MHKERKKRIKKDKCIKTDRQKHRKKERKRDIQVDRKKERTNKTKEI